MTTLLRNGIVLPMTGDREVLDPGSVLLDGTEVVAVGEVAALDADPRAAGAEVVDLTDHAVLPGLHNCHLHSGLLRGTAESLSLWDWLETYVDPAHRALTPEIARVASLQCYAESLLAGTTSVMDMWRFMEGSAAVAEELGIRATLVPYVADAEGYDYFESLASNRRLLESHRTAADGRVRAWVGLEHLLYCTPEAFREAAALAEEFDTGIHTHSSETIWEVQESLRRFGRRPLEEMFQRGILGERTVVAHCVWLDDRELQVLAQTGTAVAHCPCSNMKLSSGPARVGDMRAAGIRVGLGSDGEKENNDLDLLEEMKVASLLQKVATLDPTTGDPWDVLAMATCDGAAALGLGEVTGRLAPGMRADVISVDLRGLHTTPLLHGADLNVAAHLVFSASGRDVRDVFVDGRRLVADGVPTTFDVAAVRDQAQAAAEELFARRAALPPR
ncbi:amidohydrolase [Iamia majanohamensis]|uniref:Amidohydrolase n=1 Tax=Iamia majanohamensis TaxID=467976 RepID=A0AAE9YAP5_9ACTN|nr:amidohydrolase [Iamia majanohamensis]WCO67668.1 amidohydrolase [Iamia majanohamensis]